PKALLNSLRPLCKRNVMSLVLNDQVRVNAAVVAIDDDVGLIFRHAPRNNDFGSHSRRWIVLADNEPRNRLRANTLFWIVPIVFARLLQVVLNPVLSDLDHATVNRGKDFSRRWNTVRLW